MGGPVLHEGAGGDMGGPASLPSKGNGGGFGWHPRFKVRKYLERGLCPPDS